MSLNSYPLQKPGLRVFVLFWLHFATLFISDVIKNFRKFFDTADLWKAGVV